MTNRTRRGFLLLVLAAGLTGCDGAHPSAPSALSSPQPQQTPPRSPDTYSVSIGGVVYDTAHRQLHGAMVEVIEGAVEGYWCHSPVRPTPVCIVPTITNESGRFEFSGQFEGVTRLRASMDGYLTATLTVDSTTSSGATEFRLEPGERK